MSTQPERPTFGRRVLALLSPGREHTAFSATVLVMSAVMLSRVIGYLREAYIAYAFGAGRLTDAYVAAFTLPEFLAYMLAGGSISITFISIYSRFLSEKRPEEGQKTFSVVVTVMAVVFLAVIAVAEVFTPQFLAWWFPDFNAEQLALCVTMTRILLPTQLFFYVGAIVQAVLYSRKLFLIPSITGVIYNVGIIVGGAALGGKIGVTSLAVGAFSGAFVGPLAIASVAAHRIGLRYRPSFDTKNAAFREWVKLTVPLMLGVSLVSADDWIIRHFASGGAGDIARLNYAKRLFAVPLAVLGQAVGQASLPFFARLFGEKRMEEFGRLVNESVYKISAASFLVTSLMVAAALPAVDLVYRRGEFHFSDSGPTALFFFVFSLSLAFWCAQGLYSRAFYAANQTLTPMVAVTAITVLSLPVYSALYQRLSTWGLAVASDLGILANTTVLAVLLHRKGLVRLSGLHWGELAKALATAVAAGAAAMWVARQIPLAGSRLSDLESMAAVSVVWAVVCVGGLTLLRSTLLRDLRRRKPPDSPPT